MKKRGFGEGRWNGYGGKVKAEESIAAAAIRELHEEANVTIKEADMRKVALNIFYSPIHGQVDVHTYIVEKWEGEAEETEEMRPQWYSFDGIPYGEMWQDDQHWVPKALAGETFKGEFWFDEKDNITKFVFSEA